MNLRIIGIDPGTAIIGYSIMELTNNNYKLIDYGCIYTDSSYDMPTRLEKIYNELDTIIKLYKPDEAVIEELFFFKNQRTVIKVGQARGVVTLVAKKNGLDIYDYTPLQVKMGITGYGRATKKQVQEMVQKILKLDEIPKPDDAADAIALVITHINTTKNKIMGNFDFRINTNNFLNNDNKKIKTKNVANKITLEEYKKMIKK